jgi:hypothetical protein
LPFIIRYYLFFGNLTNPTLFGSKTLSPFAFAMLFLSFLKAFFISLQRGPIKEYFKDSKAKSIKKQINIKLKEVSKLKVTIMTAMSSLRTLIGCESIKRYFIVLITRVVPRLATCKICPK